ncbi:MAG TPA: BTAD domain-containing putative transcriptional regulator [Dongiaceae bacterium]|nr:BTAD domain-containing putative transcriptional regulator [Dongiaceae bacterium]
MSPRFVAKLSAPRQARIVPRPRVQELIDDALRAGVCWLAAPAGYGKTTALVDYLHNVGAPYVWFRVDEGDQDIARFYHYLARSLRSAKAVDRMPVFSAEYADRPREFARRFFRAYFEHLEPGTVLAFDDLHYADSADFRGMLAVMLHELPDGIRCVCMSRSLPQEELSDLALRGQIIVIDQSAIVFSDAEARNLVALRSKRGGATDVATARGWAVGLVLLAERGAAVKPAGNDDASGGQHALFDVLGRHFFYTLPSADQNMLLELNLLPEISSDLANAMIGSGEGTRLLERLYQNQLLISRVESNRDVFQLHALLREFLDYRLMMDSPPADRARLRERAATILRAAGRMDEAVILALQAEAWPLARDLILERAAPAIAQGRRTTFIEWCGKLPAAEMDAWLFYWLGVAHMPDDAAAERCFARAWAAFDQNADVRGQCLTFARAVLVKTGSWRTHEGLATWTQRAWQRLDQGLPELPPEEELLVWTAIVRSLDFTNEDWSGKSSGDALTLKLLDRLSRRSDGESTALRLLASETMMERAISIGRADFFEQAIDSVIDDLRDPAASPWALGMWLVCFGAGSSRYFHYSRRGFPYSSAEHALRAAIEIGESQSLHGVEFGALYHLQLLMKLRNDFTEFARLVARLSEIADSRYSTQVGVVADCRAALHTRQRNFAEAYRDCDRFMASIEAANEPILERWPHYVTKYQVLLADHRPKDAAALLADLLPRLEGGMHDRTTLCIRAAEALGAKWERDAATYLDHLRAFAADLRAVNWPGVLLNLPDLLAELLADALDQDIEVEFCRSMIAERHLAVPERRPASWPWALKVHVLSEFRIERNGEILDLGTKPPTRALDILRLLAISKDHACSLETLQDTLWPDLDGDQAKAACDQALHRLRRLLGAADLIVQREGRLRLVLDKVWVDLADWESRLKQLPSTSANYAAQLEVERLFLSFPGPLRLHGQAGTWSLPIAERLRDEFVELAIRLGKQCEAQNDRTSARNNYLRALESYPESARISLALIQARLAEGDVAGAIDDYSRYERTLRAAGGEAPSPAIRALIQPLLKSARLNLSA